MSEDYRMSSLIVMIPGPHTAVCLELIVHLERVNRHCNVAIYSCNCHVEIQRHKK